MKRMLIALSCAVVVGVPAAAEAVAPAFTDGAAERVAAAPTKRGFLRADASVSPTSVDPGAPLTLAATCDAGLNADPVALVGSVTDPGGAVVVTIGSSDWQ